jgi:catechol 2,3-dioxygenase-like lactoylglutathione lyase family enzyme
MPSKINHVAIVSQQYTLLAAYYRAIFKMKQSDKDRPVRAVTVGDGYVGLNINPRKAGRPAGLDHFGIQVDSVEETFERMKAFPAADYVQRPSTRPFAGISANDPDGNVFDISQAQMKNRDAIYVENSGEQAERRISHVGVRTMRPDEMARFYSDVFGLKEVNAKAGDPNHTLTDGKVQLIIIPYKIKNYVGQSILPTGMDHVGFEVESIDALKQDLEEAVGINPCLQPIPVGGGNEQKARLELLKQQCPVGEYFLSDPDFTMIAVSQRH